MYLQQIMCTQMKHPSQLPLQNASTYSPKNKWLNSREFPVRSIFYSNGFILLDKSSLKNHDMVLIYKLSFTLVERTGSVLYCELWASIDQKNSACFWHRILIPTVHTRKDLMLAVGVFESILDKNCQPQMMDDRRRGRILAESWDTPGAMSGGHDQCRTGDLVDDGSGRSTSIFGRKETLLK